MSYPPRRLDAAPTTASQPPLFLPATPWLSFLCRPSAYFIAYRMLLRHYYISPRHSPFIERQPFILFSPTHRFFITDTPGRTSAATPPPPFRTASGCLWPHYYQRACNYMPDLEPQDIVGRRQQEEAAGEGVAWRLTGGWGAINSASISTWVLPFLRKRVVWNLCALHSGTFGAPLTVPGHSWRAGTGAARTGTATAAAPAAAPAAAGPLNQASSLPCGHGRWEGARWGQPEAAPAPCGAATAGWKIGGASLSLTLVAWGSNGAAPALLSTFPLSSIHSPFPLHCCLLGPSP